MRERETLHTHTTRDRAEDEDPEDIPEQSSRTHSMSERALSREKHKHGFWSYKYNPEVDVHPKCSNHSPLNRTLWV